MKYLSVTDARKNLFSLVNESDSYDDPVVIVGRKKTAFLVSQEEWEGLQETLLIMSNKQLAESILEGMNAPDEEFCTRDQLPW